MPRLIPLAIVCCALSLVSPADELVVHPPTLPTTTPSPLAQRALTLTRREVASLRKSFHPWDKDNSALIFTKGGHTEHEVRPQTQAMIGFAVVARFSPDDSERKQSLADTIAMLRFVAPTHSASDITCSNGKKWKAQWQSALWAYQAGFAAWLVWDQLPADLQPLIANMVAVEADRFVDQDPPHQIKNDTKAEENAWNSTVVSLAAAMMPTDPRTPAWRKTAIRWQLSSFLTQDDTQSPQVIDGQPLRDYKLGPNIHPDYSLENHQRVHPSYMGTIGLNLVQHFNYRWAKQKSPDALNFNALPIYTLLKRFSHPDGRMHFPNGQDWELHRWTPSIHAKMSVLYNDPEAAYLERVSLDTMEKMQARFTDGHTMLREEYIFPSLPGMVVASYANTFLIHLEYGEGPAPCSEAEFLKNNTGVWHMKDGQFIFHRTPSAFVSFSWGSKVMGQAIPFTMDLLGSPFEAGFVGTITAETPVGWAYSPTTSPSPVRDTPAPKVADIRVTPRDDGFDVSARLLRCDGAIEQKIIFSSFPSGTVLYAQQIKALRDVKLKTLQLGSIGIINEPQWVYQSGPRHISWSGGQTDIDGLKPLPPTPHKTDWLNIADAWSFYPLNAEGFILSGTGKAARGRREQLLTLIPPTKLDYKAKEIIATNGLLIDPLTKSTSAPARAKSLKPTTDDSSLDVTVGPRHFHLTFDTPLPQIK